MTFRPDCPPNEDAAAESFKIRDAESYDGVVESFDRWTERFSTEFAAQLVSAVAPRGNDRILDVGCGTGVVARQAARALAREGRVVGIDLSREMLAKAARLAKREGLAERISFERSDAENLDHEDASFDAVVSLYAILHFPNPIDALSEMRRVLRPGGRLAIGLGSSAPLFSWQGWINRVRRAPELLLRPMGRWANAPQLLDSLVDELARERSDAARQVDDASELTMHPHRSRDLVRALHRLGFTRVRARWQGRRAFFESSEDFYDLQATFNTHARKRLEEMTDEERQRVRQRFLERCQSILGRRGRLSYPYAALFLSARSPGSTPGDS